MNLLYIDLIKESKKIYNINLAELEVASGTVTKTVDKQRVNLEENFIYTINASFSGITGNITSAKIEDFIPEYIQYTLPPTGGLLRSIKEENATVSGERGKKIIFDFGSISDLGQAIALDLSCRFKFGTNNGTIFTNKAILKVNSDAPIEKAAHPVTLILNPDFELTKEVKIPSSIGPSVGGILIYILTLKNKLRSTGEGNGDLGAKIKNVVIRDTLPAGVIIDSSITEPTGFDVSRYDARTDNLTINQASNSITFTLSDYYGTEYKFIYAVRVPGTLNVGAALKNNVTWTSDPRPKPPPTTTITTTIADDRYRADLIKSGPTHASAGNKISYEIFVRNPGNKDLINVEIVDTIPPEVTVNRINTGRFCIALEGKSFYLNATMTIEYEVDNNGRYINLGSYQADQLQSIDLTNKVSSRQKITKIKWILPKLPVGYESCNQIYIDGVLNSNIIAPIVVNKVQLTADNNVDVKGEFETKIDGLSVIRIIKNEVSPNTDVISGQTIRYKLRVLADRSQLDNPIITDLLDDKVEYANNEFYKYYNYFDNQNIEGDKSTFEAQGSRVNVEITSNFNGTRRTLIRYKFNDGFKLEQRGEFSVEFDVIVKSGVIGEIINTGVLGNKGAKGIIDNNDLLPGSKRYIDTDDRDGDGVTNEDLVESNEVKNNIIVTKSILSDKKVKGPLDSDFTEHPSKGKTYQGGVIEYKLTVQNIGSSVLNSIELIDILPRRGDTGVIDTTSRGSQFEVYEVSEVKAEISPPKNPVPNIKIEYSTSVDPIRFNNTGQTIGTGNWSAIAPVPIVSNRAFKITSSNLNLTQGESLIITVKTITPVGVPIGFIAWNSFALKGTYIENGSIQSFLPVEPEKVGVEVKAVPNGKGKIGDFVWHDLNGNGIQDSNEPGVNGVTVELYDNNGVNKGSTITTNDFNNNPGFYLFNNLDPGQYQVKFYKPNGFDFTLINQGSDITKNSKAKSSGNTDRITLSAGEENLNMDAGLVKLGKVGDTVWLDLNEDGIQQPDESGISGVTVNLYDCIDVSQSTIKYTATTDANGMYLINNVKPGRYFAVFSKPQGYRFVTTGNLVDETGKGSCFTLQSGEENLDVDAPLIDEKNINVTKGVDKNKAEIGEELTYTITIINNGVKSLKNVTLIDKIPNGTSFVSGSITVGGASKPEGASDLESGLIIGDVKSNETIIVKFKVRIKETLPIPQQVKNGVKVTFDGGEEEPPEVVTDVIKSFIGDFVWYDSNGNGIQDAGEHGVENVTVRLYKSSDRNNPISTTRTDSSGKYLFDNLKSGNYVVEFVKPTGYNFTRKGAGTNNDINSKVDIDTGITDIINLNKGEARLNIDAGLVDIKDVKTKKGVDKIEAEIGEEITYEITVTNNGVAKVRNVQLIDRLPQGTTFISNSITVNGVFKNGATLDNNINIGDIEPKANSIVRFKVRVNEIGVNLKKVKNKAKITFVGGEEDPPEVVTDVIKSSIGDFVWYDSNGNGIQDASEPGIENVTVRLYEVNNINAIRTIVTDLRGNYLFDNLKSGNYIVEFVKPAGYNFTRKGVGSDNDKNSKADISTGKTDNITLNKGEARLNIDAGLIDIKDVKTKKDVDKIQAEIGEELTYTIEIINDGIKPIRNVKLIDKIPDGTVFVSNSITVRNRPVLDGNLEVGINIGEIGSKEIVEVKFKVKINDSGFIPKKVTNKAKIIFDGGEEEPPPVVTDVIKSSIGDFVWEDLNGNGLQDAGEAGIAGVTVRLYKSNNLSDSINTAITNSVGNYLFDNLKAGNYVVEFVKPIGYNFTIKDAVGNNNLTSKANEITGKTDNIALNKGEERLNIDAGLIQPSSIGDTAWLDRNEDGVQQTDEPGVGNVSVTLYNCIDNSITLYTSVTDREGKYYISNIKPGSYYAKFTKPPGYNFVTVGGFVDATGKGKCFSIQSGQIKLDVDVPLIDIKNVDVDKTVNLTTAQIGDELLYTVTVINKGVAPIVNVRMLDPIPPGTVFINGSVQVNNLPRPNDNPQNGILIGTMQPNERSTVIFKVRIGNILPKPNPIVNKAKITFTGGDKETPPVITDVVKSSIGDFVWEDLNGDGIQDVNEPGIGNIRVNLYLADNLRTSIRNTRTNLNGNYLFDNLRSGNYIVEFIKDDNTEFTIKNAGLDDNVNSKVNQLTGKTDNISLRIDEKRQNIDAGIVSLATVGDKAWLDLNENGIEEPGEPGVGGVKITLYDCDTEIPTQYTAVTDSRGMYLITGVKPGKYYGIFIPKPGYGFVTVGNLVDENGRTQCFTIKSGEKKLDVDVPLKKVPCVIETCICGKVIDKCTCLGVECIEVFLMKANVVILKTTTDCMGMYCFKITTPGMYKIVFATMCCGYYITPRVLKINVECGESICDLVTVVCMNKLPERHCKVVCVEQPCCTCEKCSMKKCYKKSCENNICCNDNLYNKNN